MRKNVIAPALSAMLFALCIPASAQQPKVYRIGVLVPGDLWYEVIDGLKVGLTELGFQEGKDFVLEIRNSKGDLKAAAEAAKELEYEKVDLLYAAATSVTIPAKRATTEIPIVFVAGADPVTLGLVDSFAKSGGRLAGVYSRVADLTAKRIAILQEIVPKLRRLGTFYDPHNPVPSQSAKLARATVRAMGLQLVETHITSTEELRARVRTLRAGEMDGFFSISDAIVNNNGQMIVDAAREIKLPTMWDFQGNVIKGGLGSYSVSFHEMGRVSAKYIQRILAGAKPKDMPVEAVDKIELVINLKTAKQIGLTIPPNVLVKADKVIR
jgi:putative ABC transport system substrate-binding protein